MDTSAAASSRRRRCVSSLLEEMPPPPPPPPPPRGRWAFLWCIASVLSPTLCPCNDAEVGLLLLLLLLLRLLLLLLLRAFSIIRDSIRPIEEVPVNA